MRLFILISIALLFGCKQEQLDPDMIILGHAGEGVDFMQVSSLPNSMASISAALEIYALDGVEVDLQFSSDVKPFLYHDKYLEESTNGKGLLHQTASGDLELLDYRGAQSVGPVQKLLSGEDLVDYITTLGTRPYISLNVKNYQSDLNLASAAKALRTLILDLGGYERNFVESDNAQLLDSLKALDPQLICLKNGNIDAVDYALTKDHGWNGVVCHFSNAEQQWIDSFKQNKLWMVTYGQTNVSDMQHSGTLQSDVIQVDNPILAKQSR